MIPKQQITGIVLAGGESSRFGSNQAMATWQEETLLQRAVDLLQPFCREVFIGGDYPQYASLAETVLADSIPGLGPMGGIYTALTHTYTPYLLFLTCDMPLMNTALVERLLSAGPFREMTLWEQAGGTLQFFPLLLTRSLQPLISYKIQQRDLSLRSLLKEATSWFIPIHHQEEKYFLNINREEDWVEIVKYT